MKTSERLYKIDGLLSATGGLSTRELAERLGISQATVLRDIAYMRDKLHLPIVRTRNVGWHFHNVGTRRRITVEVAEAKNTPKGERPELLAEFPELLLPFGFCNRQWEALKARMGPGDELWEYCSDGGSWANLAGRKAIELLRDGRVIASITTQMN